MIPYQMTAAAIAIVVAFFILYLVRRDHLHGPYALWWLSVAIAVLVLGLLPKIVDGLAGILGVNYPPALIAAAGMGVILIKMLTMDLERSRQERKLRSLTQRLAVLEASLEHSQAKEDEHRDDLQQDPVEAGVVAGPRSILGEEEYGEDDGER